MRTPAAFIAGDGALLAKAPLRFQRGASKLPIDAVTGGRLFAVRGAADVSAAPEKTIRLVPR